MCFTAIGTAAPPHRHAQRDCWDALENSALVAGLAPRSRAIRHDAVSDGLW
jgi:hypothetical protein